MAWSHQKLIISTFASFLLALIYLRGIQTTWELGREIHKEPPSAIIWGFLLVTATCLPFKMERNVGECECSKCSVTTKNMKLILQPICNSQEWSMESGKLISCNYDHLLEVNELSYIGALFAIKIVGTCICWYCVAHYNEYYICTLLVMQIIIIYIIGVAFCPTRRLHFVITMQLYSCWCIPWSVLGRKRQEYNIHMVGERV